MAASEFETTVSVCVGMLVRTPMQSEEELSAWLAKGNVGLRDQPTFFNSAINSLSSGRLALLRRCGWANGDPLLLNYHDTEWGVPLHDDSKLFEFLVLEGAQAGLSWLTILKKRSNYQEAFREFDANKVARFTKRDLKRLLANTGIVRNRLKILATINNAHKFLDIRGEFGSFDSYIWQFTEGKPIQHRYRSLKQMPAKTIESDRMSKALQERGFRFVGSVICYSFMQAVGMVNDHTISCFRHREVQGQ